MLASLLFVSVWAHQQTLFYNKLNNPILKYCNEIILYCPAHPHLSHSFPLILPTLQGMSFLWMTNKIRHFLQRATIETGTCQDEDCRSSNSFYHCFELSYSLRWNCLTDYLAIPLGGRDTWTNHLWLVVTWKYGRKCFALLIYVSSVFPMSFVHIQAGNRLTPREICDKSPGFYSQKPKLIKNSSALNKRDTQ